MSQDSPLEAGTSKAGGMVGTVLHNCWRHLSTERRAIHSSVDD